MCVGTKEQDISPFRPHLHGLGILTTCRRPALGDACCTKQTKPFSFLHHGRPRLYHMQKRHAWIRKPLMIQHPAEMRWGGKACNTVLLHVQKLLETAIARITTSVSVACIITLDIPLSMAWNAWYRTLVSAYVCVQCNAERSSIVDEMAFLPYVIICGDDVVLQLPENEIDHLCLYQHIGSLPSSLEWMYFSRSSCDFLQYHDFDKPVL